MRLYLCIVFVGLMSSVLFAQTEPQTDFAKELLKIMELDEQQIAILDKIEIGHQTMLARAVSDNQDKSARNEAIRDINSNKEQMIAETLTEKQYEKYKQHVKKQREMRREKEADRLKSARALNAEEGEKEKENKQR